MQKATTTITAPRGGGNSLYAGKRRLLPWFPCRRWYYGWTVVAIVFLTVSASLGTRAAFGVLLVPVADGLGWSRGMVAGAIALNNVLWAVSAAPVGALLDRWGPRPVFAGAAILTGLGLTL